MAKKKAAKKKRSAAELHRRLLDRLDYQRAFTARYPGPPGRSNAGKKRVAHKKRAAGKRNPSTPIKSKRVTQSSGWIPASAVRFVKKRGDPIQVLVRKPKR
jgi:hypothetical protein